MKTIKVFFLFAAIIASAAVSAQQKIAVVDMQKIFSGYDKTKAIELQLNQQVEVYKEYAARLMKEYQADRAEFERLRDESQNVSLSDAERENRKMRAMEKLESVKRKENELKEYNQSRQAQLKQHFDKLRAEVLQEIKQVVRNKCILEGWTLVFDKAGHTLNDLPLIIYNSPEIDLTKSVLDE